MLAVQKKERSKFPLLDETEFRLARKLIENSFNSTDDSAMPMHVGATLGDKLRKVRPNEDELDHLLNKPTAKQVHCCVP